MAQQIMLRELQRPKKININEDIDWLGESFGFSAGRDTDKVTAKILRSVIYEVANIGCTSTEKISKGLNIEVQKTNYHLKTLVDAGFLYREKRSILVRQGSVKSAVEEIRKDANRIFDSLSVIAEEIDKSLGLKNR
jgi:predicted transcriptional regulator